MPQIFPGSDDVRVIHAPQSRQILSPYWKRHIHLHLFVIWNVKYHRAGCMGHQDQAFHSHVLHALVTLVVELDYIDKKVDQLQLLLDRLLKGTSTKCLAFVIFLHWCDIVRYDMWVTWFPKSADRNVRKTELICILWESPHQHIWVRCFPKRVHHTMRNTELCELFEKHLDNLTHCNDCVHGSGFERDFGSKPERHHIPSSGVPGVAWTGTSLPWFACKKNRTRHCIMRRRDHVRFHWREMDLQPHACDIWVSGFA